MKFLSILFLASLLLGQIGGMSPFPGVVVYAHDVVLFVLLVYFFGYKKFIRPKLTISIAAFIGAGVLSLLVNYWRIPLPALLTGSLYLVRWIFYASVYLLVSQASIDRKFWLNGLYTAGVGMGFIGLMQFFLYPNLRNLAYLGWDPHYYRLFSTLLDPNFMGIILVFTLLLGFGILTKQNRVIVACGQLISFVALLLTYSRSSYLALGAAMVTWAVMKKSRKLFIFLAAFGGFVLFLPHGSTLSLLRSDSTLARVGNWQQSVALIAKAPLFGYGFDTLRFFQPAPAGIISKSAAGLDSSILFILATTGIVGFAAYASLFISMIKAGRHVTFYVASITALLVHSLFVNSMFYPWVLIWLWAVTGAVTYDT